MASNEHATGVNAIIRQQQALVEDPDLREQLGLTDAGPDGEPPADTQVPHCRDCGSPLNWQREDGALCPTCATDGGDGDE
jgi:hypothetical protein